MHGLLDNKKKKSKEIVIEDDIEKLSCFKSHKNRRIEYEEHTKDKDQKISPTREGNLSSAEDTNDNHCKTCSDNHDDNITKTNEKRLFFFRKTLKEENVLFNYYQIYNKVSKGFNDVNNCFYDLSISYQRSKKFMKRLQKVNGKSSRFISLLLCILSIIFYICRFFYGVVCKFYGFFRIIFEKICPYMKTCFLSIVHKDFLARWIRFLDVCKNKILDLYYNKIRHEILNGKVNNRNIIARCICSFSISLAFVLQIFCFFIEEASNFLYLKLKIIIFFVYITVKSIKNFVGYIFEEIKFRLYKEYYKKIYDIDYRTDSKVFKIAYKNRKRRKIRFINLES